MLYIITSVFNPQGYKSRIKLYRQFEEYIRGVNNVELYTVELAFKDKPFEVTHESNPRHLQLRSNSILWHKERLLNLVMRKLPSCWNRVAWIDSDVMFARPTWAMDALRELDTHGVVQLFGQAADLNPSGEILKLHHGIVAAKYKGLLQGKKKYDDFHPGFAWAARRDILDRLGGLFDVGILGSGDRHMALSLLGVLSYQRDLSQGYVQRLRAWHSKASGISVGYVPGLLLHYWHGRKQDRQYGSRWKILTKYGFDPQVDLQCDTQGVFSFTQRCPDLHRDSIEYFKLRNEDSEDV